MRNRNPDKPYEGRVAVVLGAAEKSGRKNLGAVAAERLAELGASVIVADVEKPSASAVVASIRKATPDADVVAYKLDLTQPKSFSRFFDQVHKHMGVPTIVINTAAFYPPKASVGKGTPEEWDLAMKINLSGPMQLTETWAAKLKEWQHKTKDAVCIHTLSDSALKAWAAVTLYSTAKAGLLQGVRNLAHCLIKRRVRVNAVVPGLIDAPASDNISKAKLTKILAGTLSKKRIPPEQIVMSMLHIIDQTHMTGEALNVTDAMVI